MLSFQQMNKNVFCKIIIIFPQNVTLLIKQHVELIRIIIYQVQNITCVNWNESLENTVVGFSAQEGTFVNFQQFV